MKSIQTAFEILLKVEKEKAYADKLLDNLRRGNLVNLPFITELVNGTIRWQLRLDWQIQNSIHKKIHKLQTKLKIILRLGIYQLLFIESLKKEVIVNESVNLAKKELGLHWGNFVNAVLRNFEEETDYPKDVVKRISIAYSHPEWLVKRWLSEFGELKTIDLCKADNERPKITFRLNATIFTEEQLFLELSRDFCKKTEVKNFYEVFTFRQIKPFLIKGLASIQNTSAGIPGILLDPKKGEKILDACCAPGGKLTHIAELSNCEAEIIGLDKYEAKQKLIYQNIKRLGLKNITLVVGNAAEFTYTEKFDKIIADVPCSGLGVLNKRVDMRWKRQSEGIEKITKVQSEILENLANNLKKNGILVYCTCSIDSRENEEIIYKFLRNHPEFKIEPAVGKVPREFLTDEGFVRTFQYQSNFDGSFAAKLVKTS